MLSTLLSNESLDECTNEFRRCPPKTCALWIAECLLHCQTTHPVVNNIIKWAAKVQSELRNVGGLGNTLRRPSFGARDKSVSLAPQYGAKSPLWQVHSATYTRGMLGAYGGKQCDMLADEEPGSVGKPGRRARTSSRNGTQAVY